MLWGAGSAWRVDVPPPPRPLLSGELIKEDLGKGEGGRARLGAFIGVSAALCLSFPSRHCGRAGPAAAAAPQMLPVGPCIPGGDGGLGALAPAAQPLQSSSN